MEIGTVVKELRIQRKITQKELATKLKVSQTYVTLIESGKRTPSYENLILLADFFGVSVDYMLGRSAEPFGPVYNEDVITLLNTFYDNNDVMKILEQTRSTENCKNCVLVNYLCGVIIKWRTE